MLLPVLGLLGLCVGLTRALPQLVRLLRTRDVAGLSVDGCATAAVVSSFWATYGLMTGQPAVVFASGTPALVFFLIALAALRYGRKVAEFRTAPVMLAVFTVVTVAAGAVGLGMALTVGALIANTPHLIVAFREKDLSGISPSTWALTMTDGAIWVTYSVVTGDIPIFVNNFFQVTTSGLILLRRWWWARSVTTDVTTPSTVGVSS